MWGPNEVLPGTGSSTCFSLPPSLILAEEHRALRGYEIESQGTEGITA